MICRQFQNDSSCNDVSGRLPDHNRTIHGIKRLGGENCGYCRLNTISHYSYLLTPIFNLIKIVVLISISVDYNILNRPTSNLLTTVKNILIMMSRAIARILFLTPYVITAVQKYEEMENPITMLKAMAMTIKVYWSSQFFLWQHHPLFWRMKILMLHIVMFPIYLFYELLQ